MKISNLYSYQIISTLVIGPKLSILSAKYKSYWCNEIPWNSQVWSEKCYDMKIFGLVSKFDIQTERIPLEFVSWVVIYVRPTSNFQNHLGATRHQSRQVHRTFKKTPTFSGELHRKLISNSTEVSTNTIWPEGFVWAKLFFQYFQTSEKSGQTNTTWGSSTRM